MSVNHIARMQLLFRIVGFVVLRPTQFAIEADTDLADENKLPSCFESPPFWKAAVGASD